MNEDTEERPQERPWKISSRSQICRKRGDPGGRCWSIGDLITKAKQGPEKHNNKTREQRTNDHHERDEPKLN